MSSNVDKKNEESDVCAVDFAFRRIGGKYKGRILWHLNRHNILRYGELKKEMNNITTKMLTQTLRQLEQDELINRKVYHQVPPKVEYSLTEIGYELIPFVHYLENWGKKQLENKNQ
ncbi:winged helix-turn-helix transcriptional regulator [Psychroflexus halocasei]|uniref:DNA-binding transcriptional regulator, HxlR family n=1 Tax=Psychroflexus halocasei TaxID=908615 RepID=A0A1H4DVF1_9FLAO|nr:helix-turn-helix domain-containing protein [Psychroflexus halocasei]SEA76576.1 DNA-binding transcriptional regulator, HxlR family [Psychroflexus halocasei]